MCTHGVTSWDSHLTAARTVSVPSSRYSSRVTAWLESRRSVRGLGNALIGCQSVSCDRMRTVLIAGPDRNGRVYPFSFALSAESPLLLGVRKPRLAHSSSLGLDSRRSQRVIDRPRVHS